MQVQWMEKPKPTVGHTYWSATASSQPKRALPQLWTCSGYKLASTYCSPWSCCNNEQTCIPVMHLHFFYTLITANHVSHLENVSEDEINRLLGMVVDVENLFMSVHKEEDTDTKQVYFYLFKVWKRHSNISVIVILVQLNLEVDVHDIFLAWYKLVSLLLHSFLQLLRKCILQMSQPVVEGSLGSPPFEKPNIEQVNFKKIASVNVLVLSSVLTGEHRL